MYDTRAFAAFLESQPADRGYNWMERVACPIGRFFAERGQDYTQMPYAGPWEINVTMPSPHTYGAAAKRARELV